jgi:hypothetical protein
MFSGVITPMFSGVITPMFSGVITPMFSGVPLLYPAIIGTCLTVENRHV